MDMTLNSLAYQLLAICTNNYTYIKPTHYLSTKAVRKHTAILGLHLSTNHIISHISVMTGNCSVICVIHTLDKEHINIIFRIISDVLY